MGGHGFIICLYPPSWVVMLQDTRHPTLVWRRLPCPYNGFVKEGDLWNIRHSQCVIGRVRRKPTNADAGMLTVARIVLNQRCWQRIVAQFNHGSPWI